MTATATPPLKAVPTPEEAALTALKARDVTAPEQFLEQASPEGILGACKWFDDQQKRRNIGTGLLVSVLREGGKPHFGQTPPSCLPVTEKLLHAVRGMCLSPNGCRRYMAVDSFAAAAKMRGIPASVLVDQAMGPRWELTPPHPALIHAEGQLGRYNAWLSDGRDRPDVSVVREKGEGLLAYSQRFWQVEPQEAQ